MPPKDHFEAGDIQALLGHKTPLVRLWAVEALRRVSGDGALTAVLPGMTREFHPDVLGAVAGWMADSPLAAGTEASLAFLRRLKALGRTGSAITVAQALWDADPDPERRKLVEGSVPEMGDEEDGDPADAAETEPSDDDAPPDSSPNFDSLPFGELEARLATGTGDELYAVLEALAARPGEKAGRAVLTHARRVFTELDPVDAAEACKDLGAAALFDFLRSAWHPGEFALGNAVLTLAALHGLDAPELGEITRDRARSARMMESVRREGLAHVLDEAMPVMLRCRACRWAYHYEVSEIIVTTDRPDIDGSISFDRLVLCKNCGTVEDWELTPQSRVILIMETSRAHDLMELGRQSDDAGLYGRVRFAKMLSVAGKTAANKGEALRILLEMAKSNPNDAETWRRLGDSYKNGGLGEQAAAAFRNALEADPGSLQAHLGLAEVLRERGDLAGAHPHYQAVVNLGRAQSVPMPLRAEFVRHALETLILDAPRTGLPVIPGKNELLRLTEGEGDFLLDKLTEELTRPA